MWCIVGSALENDTRLLLLFLVVSRVVAVAVVDPFLTLCSDNSSSLSQKTRLA